MQNLSVALQIEEGYFYPENYQEIKNLKLKDKIKIIFTIPAQNKIFCFQHENGITSPLNKMKNKSKDDTYSQFETTFTIWTSREGVLYPILVHNKTNHIKLIKVGILGKVEIWKVGLISQAGKFFFIMQKTYDEQCSLNQDSIIYPNLAGGILSAEKNALIVILEKLLKNEDLLNFDISETVKNIDVSTLPNNTGMVMWHDLFSIACIATKQGNARLHHSSFSSERLVYLKKNQVITYESLRSPEHIPGRETKFKIEIAGKAEYIDYLPKDSI